MFSNTSLSSPDYINYSGLSDGIYFDNDSMINPPSGLKGLYSKPITIKALYDGEVFINGGKKYSPIYLTIALVNYNEYTFS